jgi:hypothetical protein
VHGSEIADRGATADDRQRTRGYIDMSTRQTAHAVNSKHAPTVVNVKRKTRTLA